MTTIVICMLKSVCARPVLGAKPGWCDRCGKTVMVAPTSRKMLAEPETECVCMECVRPDEWDEMITISEEQLHEIQDNLPPDVE